VPGYSREERPRVCLLASDLMNSQGGATAVTVWMAHALQDRSELVIHATGGALDFEELNALYGTQLDPGRIAVHYFGTYWHRRKTRLLEVTMLARKLRERPSDYDVYMSATNETVLPEPHVQYIHFPQRNFSVMRANYRGLGLLVRAVNELLCRTLNSTLRFDLSRSTVLANSSWTRSVLRELYGIDAIVQYPPVLVPPARTSWGDRELSMLAVGRFAAEKRLHEAILVADRLRERYPRMTLHIAGFGDGPYKESIREAAAIRRQYVILHDRLSRDEFAQLMGACKFGINFMHGEHFGMAAAGCVVLVHNSGGQTEIVNRDPLLVFNDLEDCCQKMSHLLSQPELAAEKAATLNRAIIATFSSQVFVETLRNIVFMQVAPATAHGTLVRA